NHWLMKTNLFFRFGNDNDNCGAALHIKPLPNSAMLIIMHARKRFTWTKLKKEAGLTLTQGNMQITCKENGPVTNVTEFVATPHIPSRQIFSDNV
ncbi:hypothetical protein PFISCL1PPCAC_26035, partial [Pristionchus fissidentatus]